MNLAPFSLTLLCLGGWGLFPQVVDTLKLAKSQPGGKNILFIELLTLDCWNIFWTKRNSWKVQLAEMMSLFRMNKGIRAHCLFF